MKQLRVLVAEANDKVRCSVVEILCRAGVQVVGAVYDGEELVESARCLLPDVVVSDIFMPRMNSLAARSKLIEHQRTIPFVFLSALGPEVVQLVPNDVAAGFVYRGDMSDHLADAIAAVFAGQFYLSPHYRESFGP